MRTSRRLLAVLTGLVAGVGLLLVAPAAAERQARPHARTAARAIVHGHVTAGVAEQAHVVRGVRAAVTSTALDAGLHGSSKHSGPGVPVRDSTGSPTPSRDRPTRRAPSATASMSWRSTRRWRSTTGRVSRSSRRSSSMRCIRIPSGRFAFDPEGHLRPVQRHVPRRVPRPGRLASALPDRHGRDPERHREQHQHVVPDVVPRRRLPREPPAVGRLSGRGIQRHAGHDHHQPVHVPEPHGQVPLLADHDDRQDRSVRLHAAGADADRLRRHEDA